MSYSDLKGKTFVITGAASGMGRLIADLLAEQGANVGLLDLHKPTKAAEEVEQLGGGKALAVACNVQNAQEVDAAVAAVRERFGEIHGAANMAGILGNQGLKGKGFALDVVKDNDWDSIVNTNLDGVKNCLRAEMNNMKTGGSIVNAASVAGQKAFAYMGPYCVSKFGVIGLTKVAAQEFGTRGIRINAVAPGVTKTPMTAVLGSDEELYEGMGLSRTALKRLGESIEVARVVVFLLSEQASYVTGSVVNVDGGYN